MNRVKFWEEANRDWETLFKRAHTTGRKKSAYRYKRLAYKAERQALMEKEKMSESDPNEMIRVGTHGNMVKKSSIS